MLVVSLTALGGVVVLAQQLGAQTPSPTQNAGPGPPSIDWSNPSQGERVSSVDEARKSLAFEPRSPRQLGSASYITVTKGERVEFRVIQFIYDDATYGRFIVSMSQSVGTVDQYNAESSGHVARMQADESSPTYAEIVQLSSGAEAMLDIDKVSGQGGISWREGSVAIVVAGPSWTRDELVAVANKV